MREIKFRGKRILEPIKIERYAPDGWVYGDFIDCSDEAYIAPKDISGEFYVEGNYRFRANDIEARVMMAQVDPNSVSQFTGLTDKNGVEIYEGDIVKFTRRMYGFKSAYNNTYITQVEYLVDKCGISQFKPFNTNDMIECEVIGNIYDNPELLKA